MNKITRFKDIPKFTRFGCYEVNVPLESIPNQIREWQKNKLHYLQLCPDFHRGYVWTETQQVAYMEYLFRGGNASKIIYFNMPSWLSDRKYDYDDFVCVDGLQRLTSVLKFMNNEIPIFGNYFREFDDGIPTDVDLLFNINNLKTKKEVLQWYVDMNAGGTPHTNGEIEKVRKMIQELG